MGASGTETQPAVQFAFHPLRYVATRALGRFRPEACWGPWSCVRYGPVPVPEPPGPDWVRVRVRLAGVCGSDLHLIRLRDSPVLSAFTSFPFTIGHELLGVVEDGGAGIPAGTRVAVDPVLSCERRGIEPPCPACARGNYSLCRRVTDGRLAPGLLIGACRDTGGSWSPYVVAHRSQLFPLPPEVDDLNGLMVEPFSCALHAVLRHPPEAGDTVLVVGAGTIGLCAVAALRALEYRCRVVVLARHGPQADLARRFGADQVVMARGDYRPELARALGGRLVRPLLGPPAVLGGADLALECAGSPRALDDALRFARGGGRVVLLGLAAITRQLDLTPIWLKELRVGGSYAYGLEDRDGQRRHTFALAIDLLRAGRADLSPLITHRFPLHRFREALATATDKRASGAIKVVLEP